MIQYFKSLKPLTLMSPATKNCVNAAKTQAKTCIKNSFYKPTANVYLKYNILNAIDKSSNSIKYEVSGEWVILLFVSWRACLNMPIIDY